MASNKSLAEHNLSQKPKLERNKQLLIDAHQNKALIQAEFEKNRTKLGKYSCPIFYSLTQIHYYSVDTPTRTLGRRLFSHNIF